jgi:capsular polysaccharide biosynthesis protein
MSSGRDLRWTMFGLLVAAGLAAGLAAAFVQSLREPTLYRAETSLVVERGNQPLSGGAGTSGLVSTFRKLIETNVVATNVIQNLALGESASTLLHRLSVEQSGSTSVLRLDVDDGDPVRATKIAQQLGLVFTQLVHNRFGQATSASVQPLAIAVFDPAHALPGKVSPHLRRDLAWGALLGLLAGLLVASFGARRPPEKRSIEGLRVLGDAGSADEVAASLIELSAQQPFQTVALAGDPEGWVTASVAHALAERGALTIWVRAADADSSELERLAARCTYVLVAAAAIDPKLSVDAAIAVTGPANVGLAESLLRQPGLRVLGTIATNGSETE